MLTGVYNPHATDLAVVDRIRGLNPELRAEDAILIACDAAVQNATLNGISCAIDGRVYEPAMLARRFGIDGSHDDAELIARAYERRGTEALRSLRGSFSLALWDARSGYGILACDLLATRQLFSYRGAGWLAFAGELHELLHILPTRPAPDPTGFLMWLGGGTCPADRTLYEGVSRLGPGELIELRDGEAHVREYWRPRYTGTINATRPALAEGLRDELQRSVGRRLSPESNGVILSGGVDSSIVAACADRALPPGARLRTYSAVFPGAEFDESDKILELTGALGLDPATYKLEPQGALRLALEHTRRWQLPLTGAGALIDAAIVREAAGDGAEVLLDGQTGDETLGFAPYLVADRLRQGRLLAALELTRRWPLGTPPTRKQRLWILRNLGLKGAAPYGLGQRVRARRDGAGGPEWLLPAQRKRFAALDDRWEWKLAASGPRWWRHLADSLIRAPHRELRVDYLRHRAAGAGVINESPLYDFDLIDFCLRLPPEHAFDWRMDRPLAREAMRGILPERVRIQPRKAVFSSFAADAMSGADAGGIEHLITGAGAALGAYVDLESVRAHWHRGRAQGRSGSLHWGTVAWRLAAAECWLRLQSDASFIDEMLARPDIPRPLVRRVQPDRSGTFFPLPLEPSGA